MTAPQVAIYARYSTDMQRAASIEDQMRLCEARAAKEGWEVYNRYADHGTSGASLMRPGIQMLLQDALAGKVQIVLAEALDRLSRDQEDIAGLYKRCQFAGVRLFTLSEGDVSELHIGLRGTMNALYLKDLADKTRRGLRGRVEAGKSGGGNAYGYDVVRRIGDDGEPEKGGRVVNEREAAIVRRIFEAYAGGTSPKAIAKTLNTEGVSAPGGAGWGASTIHGHRRRGTGILNNELYVGRLIWNKLRYIKDPETGKRVSRLNPESEWIVHDVPTLRIVDDALWQAVKDRQTKMAIHGTGKAGFWDRRRPRFLFSGLMACGTCGGSFVTLSGSRLGCNAARTKGTCTNGRTIKRQRVERTVLNGLQHHLMDPHLLQLFCAEYTAHRNRLRKDAAAQYEADRAELARLDKDLDKLVQAILDGVPGSKLKDQIADKEARKAALEDKLAGGEPDPVRLHPDMAQRYRKQVSALVAALNEDGHRQEATEIIRGLIERITLMPADDGGLTIDLEGDLAGILRLASDSKKPAADAGGLSEMKVVAGVGFEPTTFRL